LWGAIFALPSNMHYPFADVAVLQLRKHQRQEEVAWPGYDAGFIAHWCPASAKWPYSLECADAVWL